MTSLKLLRLLKDELETPYVVSYFFNGLLGGILPQGTRSEDGCFSEGNYLR